MHDLPHRLIEAFHATLEEIKEADLLLHVVDVSHPNFRNFYSAVNEVLKEIESFDKTTVLVLNKIDQLQDRHWLKEYQDHFPHAVCLSAKTQENIKGLLDKISDLLSSLVVEINIEVPIDRMDLVSLAHKEGEVYSVKYYANTIHIRGLVPKHIAGRFYSERERPKGP
jgi:GTP-binding protein HflX